MEYRLWWNSTLWNILWLFLIAAIVATILFEVWLRNSRKYILSKGMFELPRLPVIGNAHMVLGKSNLELAELGKHLLKKHEGVAVGRAWLGPMLVVCILDPVDAELVLSGSTHLEKSYEYQYFKQWFGDGILISQGHHWRHHRKMIAPTFHQSILKSFIPTFVQHSKIVVDRMSKEIGKEFDVHEYMSQTTVEILLSTVMGVEKIPANYKCLEYANAVLDMCDVVHKRQLKAIYRLDVIYNLTNLSRKGKKALQIILEMTNKLIKDRMANFNSDSRAIANDFESSINLKLQTNQPKSVGLRDDLDDIDEIDVGSKKRLALLDAMMDMSRNPNIEWTNKDIVDEVNTIMFEGHDTTSAASSFVLCLLGIHKDIQEKVLAEQKAIFDADFLRECKFADVTEMNYLERVIMETLRLYPPVPAIARQAERDIKLASGPYSIPKGTTVVIGQYGIHRNPKYFSNPEQFDPDNFLPERMSKRHYHSFIPFSAGPRSCVGRKFAILKLKILLSTILRNYSVDCKQKEEDFQLQGDIILKMANGFNISLTPRQLVD